MHRFDVWCFFERSRTFDPAVGLGTSISGVEVPPPELRKVAHIPPSSRQHSYDFGRAGFRWFKRTCGQHYFVLTKIHKNWNSLKRLHSRPSWGRIIKQIKAKHTAVEGLHVNQSRSSRTEATRPTTQLSEATARHKQCHHATAGRQAGISVASTPQQQAQPTQNVSMCRAVRLYRMWLH